MGHRRNPSEGLNVGEGFPTSYSSFAALGSSASSRPSVDDTGKSSQSQINKAGAARKRNPQSGSQGGLTFEAHSGSPVSTQKSWEGTAKGFKKHWGFVAFFVAFSALLLLGGLLPSASLKPQNGKTNSARRDALYRTVRATRDPLPSSGSTLQEPTRFARWAEALFGSSDNAAPIREQVTVPASVGDLEMPDEIVSGIREGQASEGQAEIDAEARRAVKAATRRSSKRRTDDEEDKAAREHPSRALRRQKLQATSLADEQNRHGIALAKKNQLRTRMMEKVAKVFKAGTAAFAAHNVHPNTGKMGVRDAEGQHILDTFGASHPELIDVDGGYAGF